MRRKKVLFIVNPRSGKGQIRNALLDIADIFIKGGLDVTLYVTQKPQDASRVVEKRAAKFDLVACSGGDGTLDEVVTGMMNSEIRRPIGYIPAGSTNDFANSLQIPKRMTEAAQCIVENNVYPCDVGSFNSDYFVYIAAFGMFTEVSYQTNQDVKNVLGHLAYVLEGAKCIFNVKSYEVEIELNGEKIRDEFIYGMISNSTSVGGFKGMTGKDVLLDDGVFEVTLIKKPKNPIELNEIIASLINLADDTDMIYSFKTAEVHFTAMEEIPWTLDGEFGGDHTEVTVKNICKAVEIMVPKDEPAKA